MQELSHLIEMYSSNYLSSEELIHLQSIHRLKDWLSKTDNQKQEHRKSHLEMLLIHFNDEKDLEYQKQAVITTDRILSFIQNSKFGQVDFNYCSENEKWFFRIYNMLWCEKEYIFYGENLRSTRIHIPFSVFEPLIAKVRHTEHYAIYKLEELFNDYSIMLSLFEENFGDSRDSYSKSY